MNNILVLSLSALISPLYISLSFLLTYKCDDGAHTHQAESEVEQNVATTRAQVIILRNWWLQKRINLMNLTIRDKSRLVTREMGKILPFDQCLFFFVPVASTAPVRPPVIEIQ